MVTRSDPSEVIEVRCPYTACGSELRIVNEGWWRCPKCDGAILVTRVESLLAERYRARRADDDAAWEYPRPLAMPMATARPSFDGHVVHEFNANHDLLGRFATGPGMHAPDTGGGGGPLAPAGLSYHPSDEMVAKAAKKASADIARNAREMGETPAQYEAHCAENLKKMMGDPPVLCIRQSAETALKVIEGGRFKTQFETGTSAGVFDPKYRTMAEKNGLGYAEDVSPAERPVYGFVRTDRHGGSNYGAVEFELKSSVGKRATVTMDDSLAHFGMKEQVGRPLDSPTKECWNGNSRALRNGRTPGGYIESQIQGGVRISDVRRVIIKADAFDRATGKKLLPEYKQVVAAAKKQGLEVVLDPDNY